MEYHIYIYYFKKHILRTLVDYFPSLSLTKFNFDEKGMTQWLSFCPTVIHVYCYFVFKMSDALAAFKTSAVKHLLYAVEHQALFQAEVMFMMCGCTWSRPCSYTEEHPVSLPLFTWWPFFFSLEIHEWLIRWNRGPLPSFPPPVIMNGADHILTFYSGLAASQITNYNMKTKWVPMPSTG